MTTWYDASRPLLGADAPLPLDRPFSVSQAVLRGVSRHRLRSLERVGLIRRVIKGVYVVAQVPDSVLLRGEALALIVPEHAVVTDWTACWLHTGIDRPGAHRREPEVSVFRQRGHDRLRNELCSSGERTLAAHDVWVVSGIQVTSPLRTAWDLGRLAHRDRAIGAIDALLRHGSFTHDELLQGIERFKGMRGVIQLRVLAPLAHARAQSPGESTLRLRWLDQETLPPPTPQVPIVVDGSAMYYIDLGVEELRYGCEYDGEEFHGPEQEVHDGERRDDLLDRFWWDVDAVRKAQVWGPARTVDEMLVRGVDRARRRLGRPTYLV